MPPSSPKRVLQAQSARIDEPVSSGLNLSLRLRNRINMPGLLARIIQRQPAINEALRELHFVHFARFLPTGDGKTLQVITEFDGPLDQYILDFAIAIGDVFDLILAEIRGAPPLPIRNHPDAFLEFVRENNRVRILGVKLPRDLDYPIFSAYPDRTVLDIIGARRDLPPPLPQTPHSEVDRGDIQANVLEGYHGKFARHLMYQVAEPRQGRRWLASLPVTAATPWKRPEDKPADIVNVGLTWSGLQALGVDATWLARLPRAYREGPGQAERARANGDTDDADPKHWMIGSDKATAVHVMVSVHAMTREALEARTRSLMKELPQDEAVIEIQRFDAAEREGNKEAFGYRDGIAQPQLALGPASALDKPRRDDLQPPMPVGALLLGADYPNEFGGPSLGVMPPELVSNGCFCAVRILRQDVAGFDEMLDAATPNCSRENESKSKSEQETENENENEKEKEKEKEQARNLVAARLMGRWPNGAPLMKHPDTEPPGTGCTPEMLDNAWDYEPSSEYPDLIADTAGARCPFDAHVRRANPRSSRNRGLRHNHRLVRRGLPAQWTGDKPDSIEQGLFGLFLCASLERQFEFVQQQWLKQDLFSGAICQWQNSAGGSTTKRLVVTRGSLYLLMPGLTALRALGTMPVSRAPETDVPAVLSAALSGLSRSIHFARDTSFGLAMLVDWGWRRWGRDAKQPRPPGPVVRPDASPTA